MLQQNCPSCQQTLAVPEHYAGKRVKCPKCGDAFQLPAGTEAATSTIPLAPESPAPPWTPAPVGRPPRSLDDDVPLLGGPRRLGGRRGSRGDGPSRGLIWGLAGGAALVLLLIGAPLFWLNAGYTFLTVTLVILAIGFVLGLFPLTRWMSTEVREGTLGGQAVLVYLFCLGFGLAFLACGLTVHIAFAQGTIHIDNSTVHDVRLELDGQPWLDASPGATLQKSLRRGRYNLVVRSASGQVLDEMQIAVEGPSNYVLNVLGGQFYTRGTAHYSAGANTPDTMTLENGKWFKADVDFLFQEPPTSISVSSRRGSAPSSATRTYLKRGAPPLLPNQMAPGQFQPGQFQPGQQPPGQQPPGQRPPGQFQPGQQPPGQPIPPNPGLPKKGR